MLACGLQVAESGRGDLAGLNHHVGRRLAIDSSRPVDARQVLAGLDVREAEPARAVRLPDDRLAAIDRRRVTVTLSSGVLSLSTTVPVTWPSVGWAFQVISGSAAGCSNGAPGAVSAAANLSRSAERSAHGPSTKALLGLA
ncbi:MAG TPA: hypothetical protein VFR23_08125 [Jiangellaceae bacterium]|nr:hypothetical protein [Jiangellaceae bacterium]